MATNFCLCCCPLLLAFMSRSCIGDDVVHLDYISRGVRPPPVFGDKLSVDFHFSDPVNAFDLYYVNKYTHDFFFIAIKCWCSGGSDGVQDQTLTYIKKHKVPKHYLGLNSRRRSTLRDCKSTRQRRIIEMAWGKRGR